MANTLLINRTALGTLSGGEYPTWNSQTDPNVSNLDYGELAWNNGKQKLYIARVSDISGGKTLQQVGGTTAFKVTDGSGSTDMAHDSTLTIQGTSNETTVSESSGTVTVGLPDDVVIGNDLTVTGDLTVSGDTITANVATITIEDETIELGKAASPSNTTANGSGIITTGADEKSILYSSTNDRWVSNKRFDAPTFVGDLTGDVTGNTSGSSGSCTGNAATATALATARTIGGVSFNGTANISLPGVNASGTQDTSGNAATVTTNANLTGDVTSVGNATVIAAGVIVDADVKSDAAIAYSKLGTIPTWNQDTTGEAATLASTFVIDGGTF